MGRLSQSTIFGLTRPGDQAQMHSSFPGETYCSIVQSLADLMGHRHANAANLIHVVLGSSTPTN
jgi:hypothetical protein